MVANNHRFWGKYLSHARKLGLAAVLSAGSVFALGHLQASSAYAGVPRTTHTVHMLELVRRVEALERKGVIKVVRSPSDPFTKVFYSIPTKTLHVPETVDSVGDLLKHGHEALHVFSSLKHEGDQSKNKEMSFVQELHGYMVSRTGVEGDARFHAKLQEVNGGAFHDVDFNTFKRLKSALSALYCAFGDYSADSHVRVAEFVGMHATSFNNFLRKASAFCREKKVTSRQVGFFDSNRRAAIRDALSYEK